MEKEKKIDLDLKFDLSKELKKEIVNSRYLRTTVIIIASVGTLYALGFVFQVLNFTVGHYKNFNATLQR